jgi:hypothetical protein
MTSRSSYPPVPGSLEEYAAEFDGLFRSLAQRRGFRDWLQTLLLPRDRNKTLNLLVGTIPSRRLQVCSPGRGLQVGASPMRR